MKFKILSTAYFLSLFLLFLYSFTQIDLDLTLTRLSLWQVFQKFFQHIGYFQRPLSTELYLVIILLLFLFYGVFLRISQTFKTKQMWVLIFGAAIILVFSYNAFSYDLFNYIFDAKIITHYHQNPYLHKALDYPGEYMLNFMRWTHRTYPYAPFWLVLTVPLSFIGMQFFLPTFFLFKLLMGASYLGSTYFLWKILKKLSPKKEVIGTTLFALNPLILIESLVSAHLDIVMMFFALCSIYLFIEKKFVVSFFSLIASAGIKFATGLILPVFFLKVFFKRFSWDYFFVGSIVLMLFGVVLASIRTNFQPWYYVTVIPFCSYFATRKLVAVPIFVLSLFALFEYIPYLFTGNWDPPIPMQLLEIRIAGIAISAVLVFLAVLLEK